VNSPADIMLVEVDGARAALVEVRRQAAAVTRELHTLESDALEVARSARRAAQAKYEAPTEVAMFDHEGRRRQGPDEVYVFQSPVRYPPSLGALRASTEKARGKGMFAEVLLPWEK
jgi:hypothetical protein